MVVSFPYFRVYFFTHVARYFHVKTAKSTIQTITIHNQNLSNWLFVGLIICLCGLEKKLEQKGDFGLRTLENSLSLLFFIQGYASRYSISLQ